MYPASSVADLSAVDAAVKVMEIPVQSVKDRFREETLAIPKAKVLIFLGNYVFLFVGFDIVYRLFR